MNTTSEQHASSKDDWKVSLSRLISVPENKSIIAKYHSDLWNIMGIESQISEIST